MCVCVTLGRTGTSEGTLSGSMSPFFLPPLPRPRLHAACALWVHQVGGMPSQREQTQQDLPRPHSNADHMSRGQGLVPGLETLTLPASVSRKTTEKAQLLLLKIYLFT